MVTILRIIRRTVTQSTIIFTPIACWWFIDLIRSLSQALSSYVGTERRNTWGWTTTKKKHEKSIGRMEWRCQSILVWTFLGSAAISLVLTNWNSLLSYHFAAQAMRMTWKKKIIKKTQLQQQRDTSFNLCNHGTYMHEKHYLTITHKGWGE